MGRSRQLLGERESLEVAYLIVLHGHMAEFAAPEAGAEAAVGNAAFDRAFEEVRRLLDSLAPGKGNADHRADSRERRESGFGSVIARGRHPRALEAKRPDPAEDYCFFGNCA